MAPAGDQPEKPTLHGIDGMSRKFGAPGNAGTSVAWPAGTPAGRLERFALVVRLKTISSEIALEAFPNPRFRDSGSAAKSTFCLIGFEERILGTDGNPPPPCLKAEEDPADRKNTKNNMKSKKKIVFAPSSANGQQKAPWDRKIRSTYEDLIFKDEFRDRKLNLETGSNWVRVVPAMMGAESWMLYIPAVAMKHGRFAHPRTFQEGAKGACDHAYGWFAANAPGELSSRDNPAGHRLLCDSLCAFWCLQENKAGAVEARLFLGSAFDGSGTGVAGLGYRIWQKLTEPDADVDVISEPLHPDSGTMLCIEKAQPPGARYPTYQLRVGRRSAPVQELLDRMEPSELDALCPVEKAIRQLSDEEQWDHLARVVGADTAAEIRSCVA